MKNKSIKIILAGAATSGIVLTACGVTNPGVVTPAPPPTVTQSPRALTWGEGSTSGDIYIKIDAPQPYQPGPYSHVAHPVAFQVTVTNNSATPVSAPVLLVRAGGMNLAQEFDTTVGQPWGNILTNETVTYKSGYDIPPGSDITIQAEPCVSVSTSCDSIYWHGKD